LKKRISILCSCNLITTKPVLIMRYKVNTDHFEYLDIKKSIQKKENYNTDTNQIMTSFPINAGGRTLLIGIDFNPNKIKEKSLHTQISDGETWESSGWSSNAKTKEEFIVSALRQVKEMLEAAIPEFE